MLNYIGRKIYYDKLTGNVLVVTGEMQGNVRETTIEEDFVVYPQLIGKDPATIDFIQLSFGERANEFANIGSMHVDPITKTLIIYPRLTILADKTQINANGIDTATITASSVGTDPVTFAVNGIDQVPAIIPVNGKAVFQFASNAVGTFTITAKTNLYGQNSVQVVAV